jgi:hypothetical protein
MAVCYLVDKDKMMFSKTMACFCTRTYNNDEGKERIQDLAKRFGMVDLRVDPDCEATTCLLNLVTNSKVTEMEDMDLVGYMSDVQYFSNAYDYEEARAKITDRAAKDGNAANTVLEFTGENGYVIIAVRESDIMEDPIFAPKMLLEGICRLLKAFYASDASKGYSRKGYKQALELLARMRKEETFDYYENYKPYEKALEEVCDILAAYKLGTLTFDGQIESMLDSERLVIGMQVSGDQDMLTYLLPADRDMMYMESSDFDAYSNLSYYIGKCGQRIGDYDTSRERMLNPESSFKTETEENKE